MSQLSEFRIPCLTKTAIWMVLKEPLAWIRNALPVSQLDSFALNAKNELCNGMPANEEGLVGHCASNGSSFCTCYGSPKEVPTVSNPNTEQDVNRPTYGLELGSPTITLSRHGWGLYNIGAG